MNTKHALQIGTSMVLLGCLLLGAPATASDQGQAAAEQVSEDIYIDYLDNWLYTHTGDSRGPSGAEHDLARDNILAFFLGWGLDAELESFTYYGGTGENVVATQWGTVYPDQEYIIGGHYDSVSNPGADDNASGVALVLEAARIISQYPSDYTIRYIAFDMEETGLNGAYAYVEAHAGDVILGMISADMVAYDPETDLARIYSHDSSSELREALGAAIDEYGDGLLWMDAGWIGASDHAPFDYAGYQAALLIEGSVWDNPYYHTQDDCFDTPGYLNFPYAVKMTRSIVGWLVDQAGVQVAALFIRLPEGVPDRLDPDVPTSILVQIDNGAETYLDGSAFLHYSYYGGPFETEPLIPLGGNFYEAILPPASCDATPLFYFSATGDEGSVIYNPEDAPFSLYSAVVATLTTYLADDFEDHLGWTVEDIDIETGTWERGVPAADGSRGDPTVDADGSGQCYLTDNQLGNYDVDGGPTRLISPTLDLSMTINPMVRFAVWFNCDDDIPPSQDFMDIEASDDGGASWALVATLENTDGWVVHTVPLANYITPTALVQLRFSVADNPNNSVTEAGIDALEVYELTCTPAASGDFDEDDDVDLIDCAHLQRCFSGSGTGYVLDGCSVFDFDGDDDVDPLDWSEFDALLVGPN